ncbi:hypothetical protein V8C35DRAFT_289261 [Trichoderma chlorosporum]
MAARKSRRTEMIFAEFRWIAIAWFVCVSRGEVEDLGGLYVWGTLPQSGDFALGHCSAAAGPVVPARYGAFSRSLGAGRRKRRWCMKRSIRLALL